jgi:hypothetical protein
VDNKAYKQGRPVAVVAVVVGHLFGSIARRRFSLRALAVVVGQTNNLDMLMAETRQTHPTPFRIVLEEIQGVLTVMAVTVEDTPRIGAEAEAADGIATDLAHLKIRIGKDWATTNHQTSHIMGWVVKVALIIS